MNKLLSKRKAVSITLLSILFTAMQLIGWQLSMTYQTSVHQGAFFQKVGVLSSGQLLLAALVELPILWAILFALFTLFEKVKPSERIYSPKQQLIVFSISAALLFICWIPCLLAGYPGYYNYDASEQVPQALYDEVPYSAHHPLLHTLLMGKIIALGFNLGGAQHLNDGILLHSIFQMLVCAVSFGYIIGYILKLTGRRFLSILAFLYYALFPPFAMFAMSTSKDTPFSILLQFSVLFVYDLFQDTPSFLRSKPKLAGFVITLTLMCLFRKNGIFIVILLLPFAIVMFKKYRKQHTLILLSTILLYFLVNKSLLLMLDAEAGSTEEALSVPMQQIARVYNEYGEAAFTEQELALIYDGISVDSLGDYDPFLSDNIKNNFSYEVIEDNSGDYITLWLRKLIQYPWEYIRAFLDNTYQAWYPGTSVYFEPFTEQTYYFDMNMRAGGERDTKAPRLLAFYEKIATSGGYYQKIPVLRLLFSMGAMFWVALFTFGYAVYRRNKPLTIAILAVLIYCATCLMGPVSLVRYYLILFYNFPVSIGFLLASSKCCPSEPPEQL